MYSESFVDSCYEKYSCLFWIFWNVMVLQVKETLLLNCFVQDFLLWDYHPGLSNDMWITVQFKTLWSQLHRSLMRSSHYILIRVAPFEHEQQINRHIIMSRYIIMRRHIIRQIRLQVLRISVASLTGLARMSYQLTTVTEGFSSIPMPTG